ncbi:hypothetical protein ACLOJK_015148 [Asimina triloba]
MNIELNSAVRIKVSQDPSDSHKERKSEPLQTWSSDRCRSELGGIWTRTWQSARNGINDEARRRRLEAVRSSCLSDGMVEAWNGEVGCPLTGCLFRIITK